MPSRKQIRAVRNMIAEARHKIAMSRSPAERPSELIEAAFGLIDDLLSEPPEKRSPEPPKKRLPN